MTTLLVFLHGSKGLSSHLHEVLSSRIITSVSNHSPGINAHKTFMLEAHEYGYDIICPQALQVIRPVKVGETRHGWFERSPEYKFEGRAGSYEDIVNMQLSAAHICESILEYENSTHSYENIIIGGMSRGGGMTLQLLCYLQQYPSILCRVRGIFAACSYLLKDSQLFRLKSVAKHIPILMMHGGHDPLIQHSWGHDTGVDLIASGQHVDFRTYPTGVHRLESEMLHDILLWTKDIIIQITSKNPIQAHTPKDMSSPNKKHQ